MLDMEVQFTSDQQAKLTRMAAEQGANICILPELFRIRRLSH